MTSEKLLMVFVKNPELGKVKTRLAETVGDEKALEVYRMLIDYTFKLTKEVVCDKSVFYSDFLEPEDQFIRGGYTQFVQEGRDLGEKMSNAFKHAFLTGYKNVVIIGSDCLELNAKIIAEAFVALENSEMVIGPAKDGGYYLLGMRKFYPEIFLHKPWSTKNVLKDTLSDISKLDISLKLLPALSDIDNAKDLMAHEDFFKDQADRKYEL